MDDESEKGSAADRAVSEVLGETKEDDVLANDSALESSDDASVKASERLANQSGVVLPRNRRGSQDSQESQSQSEAAGEVSQGSQSGKRKYSEMLSSDEDEDDEEEMETAAQPDMEFSNDNDFYLSLPDLMETLLEERLRPAQDRLIDLFMQDFPDLIERQRASPGVETFPENEPGRAHWRRFLARFRDARFSAPLRLMDDRPPLKEDKFILFARRCFPMTDEQAETFRRRSFDFMPSMVLFLRGAAQTGRELSKVLEPYHRVFFENLRLAGKCGVTSEAISQLIEITPSMQQELIDGSLPEQRNLREMADEDPRLEPMVHVFVKDNWPIVCRLSVGIQLTQEQLAAYEGFLDAFVKRQGKIRGTGRSFLPFGESQLKAKDAAERESSASSVTDSAVPVKMLYPRVTAPPPTFVAAQSIRLPGAAVFGAQPAGFTPRRSAAATPARSLAPPVSLEEARQQQQQEKAASAGWSNKPQTDVVDPNEQSLHGNEENEGSNAVDSAAEGDNDDESENSVVVAGSEEVTSVALEDAGDNNDGRGPSPLIVDCREGDNFPPVDETIASSQDERPMRHEYMPSQQLLDKLASLPLPTNFPNRFAFDLPEWRRKMNEVATSEFVRRPFEASPLIARAIRFGLTRGYGEGFVASANDPRDPRCPFAGKGVQLDGLFWSDATTYLAAKLYQYAGKFDLDRPNPTDSAEYSHPCAKLAFIEKTSDLAEVRELFSAEILTAFYCAAWYQEAVTVFGDTIVSAMRSAEPKGRMFLADESVVFGCGRKVPKLKAGDKTEASRKWKPVNESLNLVGKALRATYRFAGCSPCQPNYYRNLDEHDTMVVFSKRDRPIVENMRRVRRHSIPTSRLNASAMTLTQGIVMLQANPYRKLPLMLGFQRIVLLLGEEESRYRSPAEYETIWQAAIDSFPSEQILIFGQIPCRKQYDRAHRKNIMRINARLRKFLASHPASPRLSMIDFPDCLPNDPDPVKRYNWQRFFGGNQSIGVSKRGVKVWASKVVSALDYQAQGSHYRRPKPRITRRSGPTTSQANAAVENIPLPSGPGFVNIQAVRKEIVAAANAPSAESILPPGKEKYDLLFDGAEFPALQPKVINVMADKVILQAFEKWYKPDQSRLREIQAMTADLNDAVAKTVTYENLPAFAGAKLVCFGDPKVEALCFNDTEIEFSVMMADYNYDLTEASVDKAVLLMCLENAITDQARLQQLLVKPQYAAGFQYLRNESDDPLLVGKWIPATGLPIQFVIHINAWPQVRASQYFREQARQNPKFDRLVTMLMAFLAVNGLGSRGHLLDHLRLRAVQETADAVMHERRLLPNLFLRKLPEELIHQDVNPQRHRGGHSNAYFYDEPASKLESDRYPVPFRVKPSPGKTEPPPEADDLTLLDDALRLISRFDSTNQLVLRKSDRYERLTGYLIPRMRPEAPSDFGVSEELLDSDNESLPEEVYEEQEDVEPHLAGKKIAKYIYQTVDNIIEDSQIRKNASAPMNIIGTFEKRNLTIDLSRDYVDELTSTAAKVRTAFRSVQKGQLYRLLGSKTPRYSEILRLILTGQTLAPLLEDPDDPDPRPPKIRRVDKTSDLGTKGGLGPTNVSAGALLKAKVNELIAFDDVSAETTKDAASKRIPPKKPEKVQSPAKPEAAEKQRRRDKVDGPKSKDKTAERPVEKDKRKNGVETSSKADKPSVPLGGKGGPRTPSSSGTSDRTPRVQGKDNNGGAADRKRRHSRSHSRGRDGKHSSESESDGSDGYESDGAISNCTDISDLVLNMASMMGHKERERLRLEEDFHIATEKQRAFNNAEIEKIRPGRLAKIPNFEDLNLNFNTICWRCSQPKHLGHECPEFPVKAFIEFCTGPECKANKFEGFWKIDCAFHTCLICNASTDEHRTEDCPHKAKGKKCQMCGFYGHTLMCCITPGPYCSHCEKCRTEQPRHLAIFCPCTRDPKVQCIKCGDTDHVGSLCEPMKLLEISREASQFRKREVDRVGRREKRAERIEQSKSYRFPENRKERKQREKWGTPPKSGRGAAAAYRPFSSPRGRGDRQSPYRGRTFHNSGSNWGTRGGYQQSGGGRGSYEGQRGGFRGGSPAKRGNFGPSDDGACYYCHIPGHMKRDCCRNPESWNYQPNRPDFPPKDRSRDRYERQDGAGSSRDRDRRN